MPLRFDLFVQSGMSFVISSSFSKSFSLYGERVGALSIVTASKDEAARVLSQLKRTIRTNYSNPPTHGGAIVAAVLWQRLNCVRCGNRNWATMRDRIRAMRTGLVDKLASRGVARDFSFVVRSAACSAIPASPLPRSIACATSSVSMRSAPAASAWLH
jgi:aromatic-amino-acid transaminase